MNGRSRVRATFCYHKIDDKWIRTLSSRSVEAEASALEP